MDPSRGSQNSLSRRTDSMCGRRVRRWRNLDDREPKQHLCGDRPAEAPFLNLRGATGPAGDRLSHHDYYVSDQIF